MIVASWAKIELTTEDGRTVEAQAPVIVSASRSTDIPAFYADWFINRLEKGYAKWFNPFNGVPLYVSFAKTRLVVFWSKNPRPMLEKIPGRQETPLDIVEQLGRNYYFQFTLNDYEAERIEPNVPPLEARIGTFVELARRIGDSGHGNDRVIWRFDPLLLTDTLTPRLLLERMERIGDKIAPHTPRLVFSFIDIQAYAKVARNLKRAGISVREFREEEMLEVAEGVARLVKGWGISAGTCGEAADLPGIGHNRCVDDRLMVKCFPNDEVLMKFIGAQCVEPAFQSGSRLEGARQAEEGSRTARRLRLHHEQGYRRLQHLPAPVPLLLCQLKQQRGHDELAASPEKSHAETITGKF